MEANSVTLIQKIFYHSRNFLSWIIIFSAFLLLNSCNKSVIIAQSNTETDAEPPTFINFPDDIVDTCKMVFDYGKPEASDNSGEVHLAFVDETEGNCEDGMIIKRTWSAIDRAGNQIIRVQLIKLFGIGKLQEAEFETPVMDDKLYLIPNDNFTKLKIKFRMEKGDDISINIYDLQGNAMLSLEEELPAGQVLKNIDISKYSNGTYIVMVEQNGKYLSRQFVK